MRTNFERTRLIIVPDYGNVIKSFTMTLNPKHRTEKLKTKIQNHEKPNQNTAKLKTSFIERKGRKCRLIV